MSKFYDVYDSNGWYYKAVVWASENGVVNGNKDGTFAPNNNITRQEVAIILANYAKYKGHDIKSNSSLDKFVDNNRVASWAKDSVKWATENRIINGSKDKDGKISINPTSTATRGESITMIKNYIDKVN